MTLTKMEQKTAEEILRENGVTLDGENITQGYYNAVVYAVQRYADQEVIKAVEKALEIADDKVYEYEGAYAGLVSLKPEILKELEK